MTTSAIPVSLLAFGGRVKGIGITFNRFRPEVAVSAPRTVAVLHDRAGRLRGTQPPPRDGGKRMEGMEL